MIEVNQWNPHFIGNCFKVMMIKITHFSTFILPLLPEINPFSLLKCPLEEQFLILIRSFFCLASPVLEPFNGHSLLLVELLYLNIIELIIVQKFAE
jgi:hypothetical protein